MKTPAEWLLDLKDLPDAAKPHYLDWIRKIQQDAKPSQEELRKAAALVLLEMLAGHVKIEEEDKSIP